ncbi:hypothetical protein HOLleu_42651 [Holothuria leucospilota]|uniref:Uncharacterized protein n=1 Tax=Holothuria leucospilota TaxID=206669 RepID=A0A9Q0YHZ1_HOLLE|nr:hypothetical protein HOLleu_42651 [Holothuria leucospilota]
MSQMYQQASPIVMTYTMPVTHKMAYTLSALEDGLDHRLMCSVICLSMEEAG